MFDCTVHGYVKHLLQYPIFLFVKYLLQMDGNISHFPPPNAPSEYNLPFIHCYTSQ